MSADKFATLDRILRIISPFEATLPIPFKCSAAWRVGTPIDLAVFTPPTDSRPPPPCIQAKSASPAVSSSGWSRSRARVFWRRWAHSWIITASMCLVFPPGISQAAWKTHTPPPPYWNDCFCPETLHRRRASPLCCRTWRVASGQDVFHRSQMFIKPTASFFLFCRRKNKVINGTITFGKAAFWSICRFELDLVYPDHNPLVSSTISVFNLEIHPIKGNWCQSKQFKIMDAVPLPAWGGAVYIVSVFLYLLWLRRRRLDWGI